MQKRNANVTKCRYDTASTREASALGSPDVFLQLPSLSTSDVRHMFSNFAHIDHVCCKNIIFSTRSKRNFSEYGAEDRRAVSLAIL